MQQRITSPRCKMQPEDMTTAADCSGEIWLPAVSCSEEIWLPAHHANQFKYSQRIWKQICKNISDMNQGPRWVLMMKENGGGKSRATVPLKCQATLGRNFKAQMQKKLKRRSNTFLDRVYWISELGCNFPRSQQQCFKINSWKCYQSVINLVEWPILIGKSGYMRCCQGS